jgi:hypothetical protein
VLAALSFTWLGMVLAGEELPRSRGHLVYVALEVAKVALLVAAGTAALVEVA